MQGCAAILLVLVILALLIEYWSVVVWVLAGGFVYLLIRWLHKRRLADRRAEYISSFDSSPEKDLLCRYVERADAGVCDDRDIPKLKRILAPAWKFTDDEMTILIQRERTRRLKQSVRMALQNSGARTRDEYLLAYLDVCPSERNHHVDVIPQRMHRALELDEHFMEYLDGSPSPRARYLGVLHEVMIQAGVDEGVEPIGLPRLLVRAERQRELEGFKRVLEAPPGELRLPNLDTLDGIEFEQVIGVLYRKMGYSVEVTQSSGDQGADVIVEKMGVRTVIQAKCWGGSVGNSAVQEVAAAKPHYGAQRGVVVTTGTFTRGARALAESNSIELIDRHDLEELLRTHWRHPVL
ncbi:MAG: restriction endonuclease [Actinobacteria bacterium]|nr:restriction endonuclease [Actinomycetota bacterium]